MLTRQQKLDFAEVTCDFHICPNTGRVIYSTKGDDKALCGCRRPNPALPAEQPGIHLKRLLQTATATDYVEQEERSDGHG